MDKTIWTPDLSRVPEAGALGMASIQIVLSIDRARLQKWLMRHVQTKSHISDIGAGLGLGPEFQPIAISTMQSSAGLGSIPIIQPVQHRNLGRKNALNNGHGDFCEL